MTQDPRLPQADGELRQAVSDAGVKPCRECASDIPQAALKCSHCDSYQDWRGVLSINATVLSMLTALVATTISAIPVVRDAMTIQNSSIHATVSIVEADRINFLLTNSGSRPGAIIGGALFDPDALPQGGVAREGLILLSPARSGSVMVKAGEVAEASFKLHALQSGVFNKFGKYPERDCYGEMEEIDFHGLSRKREFKFGCQQVGEALLDVDNGGSSPFAEENAS